MTDNIEIPREELSALADGFDQRIRMLQTMRNRTPSKMKQKIYAGKMEELALMANLLGELFYAKDDTSKQAFYIMCGIKFKVRKQ